RCAAILPALLVRPPRRDGLGPLREDGPGGRTPRGKRNDADDGVLPGALRRLPATVQGIPGDLDDRACLDQSADFHGRKVFTPAPAQRAPGQRGPARTARAAAASAARWRRGPS